jgi:hypothetical protein
MNDPYGPPPDSQLTALGNATGPGGSGQWSGCGLSAFVALIAVVVLGLATITQTGRVVPPPPDVNSAAASSPVGPLPDVGVSATTTTVPPAPVAVAPAPAPAPTPNDGGQSQQQPSSGGGSNPAPAPAQCGYPGSIGISGGSTGSVGGSGGSFTATGTFVGVSVSGLVNCGQHYGLSIHATDGAQAHSDLNDCQMDGFNDTLTGVQSGWTVTVTLTLPPAAGC